jgi:hypothetical protein
MDEAALYDWLAQAEQQNPGALQQMIDAGLFGDTSALNQEQIRLGEGMASIPTPQGQRVGGTYIAASPLEHLATAIQRGQGLRQINDAKTAQSAAIKTKGGGMEALIRAMAQQQPRQAQQGVPQYGPGSAAPPWDPSMFVGDGTF